MTSATDVSLRAAGRSSSCSSSGPCASPSDPCVPSSDPCRLKRGKGAFGAKWTSLSFTLMTLFFAVFSLTVHTKKTTRTDARDKAATRAMKRRKPARLRLTRTAALCGVQRPQQFEDDYVDHDENDGSADILGSHCPLSFSLSTGTRSFYGTRPFGQARICAPRTHSRNYCSSIPPSRPRKPVLSITSRLGALIARTAGGAEKAKPAPASGAVGLKRRQIYAFFTFSQSASNFARPSAVSGCLTQFFKAPKGTVAMSAPMSAAAVTWYGLRMEAAMISHSWPKS